MCSDEQARYMGMVLQDTYPGIKKTAGRRTFRERRTGARG